MVYLTSQWFSSDETPLRLHLFSNLCSYSRPHPWTPAFCLSTRTAKSFVTMLWSFLLQSFVQRKNKIIMFVLTSNNNFVSVTLCTGLIHREHKYSSRYFTGDVSHSHPGLFVMLSLHAFILFTFYVCILIYFI